MRPLPLFVFNMLFDVEPRPWVPAADMSGSNAWAEFAGLFLAARQAALHHERVSGSPHPAPGSPGWDVSPDPVPTDFLGRHRWIIDPKGLRKHPP